MLGRPRGEHDWVGALAPHALSGILSGRSLQGDYDFFAVIRGMIGRRLGDVVCIYACDQRSSFDDDCQILLRSAKPFTGSLDIGLCCPR